MFFWKRRQPKVSLFLKFFNDIQEQQTEITSQIEKLNWGANNKTVNHSSDEKSDKPAAPTISSSQPNSHSSH